MAEAVSVDSAGDVTLCSGGEYEFVEYGSSGPD